MKPAGKILTLGVKGILRIICKVEGSQLKAIPHSGPLIIIVNHINFLEVPLLSTKLLPRDFCALAKKETWDNPVLRILADSWGGIPLDRENPGIASFRASLQALKDNKILFIAPEGTRTGDGVLIRGHLGVVSLALKSGAPILPVAHYGGEKFWSNIKRLKRTKVSFRVGTPLYIEKPQKLHHEVKQEIADQLMYELAGLLPPAYRGYYSTKREIVQQYVFPLTLE